MDDGNFMHEESNKRENFINNAIFRFAQDDETKHVIVSDSERSKVAFTLAEVLITLGIIGVVAALTLPSVIQDYKDRADVAKFKTAYSLVTQAFNAAVAAHGEITYWDSTVNMRDYLAEEMNAVKKYDSSEKYYGFIDFINMNGNQVKNSLIYGRPGFLAKNGMYLFFSTFFNKMENCANLTAKDYCASIAVDINGKNPPNRYGFDVFNLSISPKGKIRAYGQQIPRCNPTKDTSSDGHPNGESCINWVLLNGNMDYKKCLQGNQKYCEIDYNTYTD